MLVEASINKQVRRLWVALRAGFGVALFWYVISSSGGWAATQRLLLGGWIVPGLVGLAVVGGAIESKRLSLLFRSQGISLDFSRACSLVAVGTLFNFCIPGGTGGDVVKLYYLAASNQGRRVEVATVLLVDRAVGLFSMLVVIAGFAVMNLELIWAEPTIGALAACAFGGLVLLTTSAVVGCSERVRSSRPFLYALRRKRLGLYLARVADAVYGFRSHWRAVLMATLVSLVGRLGFAAMLVWTASIVMPGARPATVCFLGPLGTLATALPVTPGGLGVGEAAFEALFRLVDLQGGAQLILSWRMALLPLCAVGAVLYGAGIQRRTLLVSKSASGHSVVREEAVNNWSVGRT